jgi:hypothetical protein
MRSGPAAGVLVTAVVLAVPACSPVKIVNTGEVPAPTAPSASRPPAPADNANLANAFDFYAQSNGQPGYYFTTPSGKWRCAILPRAKAGCQSATNPRSSMGIPGEPDTVTNAAGETKPPNALVVDFEGDSHFASLDQPELSLVPGPAKALPFNKILAAAGFRCNVQQIGVSCLSESTGNGFTFSAAGYTLSYTDVAGPPR